MFIEGFDCRFVELIVVNFFLVYNVVGRLIVSLFVVNCDCICLVQFVFQCNVCLLWIDDNLMIVFRVQLKGEG